MTIEHFISLTGSYTEAYFFFICFTDFALGAGLITETLTTSSKVPFINNLLSYFSDLFFFPFQSDSADRYAVVQTLYTRMRAKTMALDKVTRKIYLSAPTFELGTRKIIPGTFAVLVYKMN